MSYNAIRPRQLQNQQGLGMYNSASHSKSHARDQMSEDVFPILHVQDIVTCLSECDFAIATQENILRPSTAFVTTLYKQIIDSFNGVSTDELIEQQQQQSNRQQQQQQQQQQQESYSATELNDPDTINLFILNKMCFQFFKSIGIENFNILDLYRPDVDRTVRILSAVVNYARFREGRMDDCAEVFHESEKLLSQLKTKFEENNKIGEQYGEYKDININTVTDEITSFEKENYDLKESLKAVVIQRDAFTNEYEEYKNNKKELLADLEELGYQEIELESEKEKLSKYCEMNTQEIDSMIHELERKLYEEQEALSQLQNEQHDLIKKKDSYTNIFNDLNKALNFVITEIQESQFKSTQLKELQLQNESTCKKLQNLLDSNIAVKCSNLEQQIEQQSKAWSEYQQQQHEKETENKQILSELDNQFKNEVIPRVSKDKEYITQELISGKLQTLTDQIETLKKESAEQIRISEAEYTDFSNHINNYINSFLKEVYNS